MTTERELIEECEERAKVPTPEEEPESETPSTWVDFARDISSPLGIGLVLIAAGLAWRLAFH